MVKAEKFSDHSHARGTLAEELYMFMRISRVFPLRMRKNVVQNIKTHFMFNFFEICAVNEILYKNSVEPQRAHIICALHAGHVRL
jgi:ABC-type enterochelin transport system permease subunit